MQEIWKDVKGYEGYYQVSNLGRIKSISRKSSNNMVTKEKIKKTWVTNIGYEYVNLCKDGGNKSYGVHILVLSAFVDKPNDKYEVDHIDRNKLNNNLENLRWVTHKENMRSWIPFAEKHYCKKCKKELTTRTKTGLCVRCLGEENRKVKRPSKEELLQDIYNIHNFVEIGRKYGVSDNAVRKWCLSYNIPYKTSEIMGIINPKKYCKSCGRDITGNEEDICYICKYDLEHPLGKPSKEQFIADIEELKSCTKISKKYNVERHTVYKWRKEYLGK